MRTVSFPFCHFLRLTSVLTACSLATITLPSQAAVTQPDGTVMPITQNNGEVTLQELFDFRNDPLDAVADASTEPATFRPLCDITAQLLLHETGNKSSMGWYNSPATNTPPTTLCDESTGKNNLNEDCSEKDVFLLVPGDVAEPPYGEWNDPLNNPGQIFTGSDIANHEHYAGGGVGFVLLTDQKHYSELRFNPECVETGAGGAGSCPEGERWIPTILYASKSQAQTYYMCSEDQVVGPSEWGNNDGDFNDYVFVFTGLVCSGSGEACDTGLPGICSAGLTSCANAAGESECKPARTALDEECNALDDDCDGQIDDGELCPKGELCVKGRCMPKCGTGEFRCPSDFVCVEGACVESACVQTECEAGRICIGGECKGACDGVVCPYGQSCLDGACIDACEGIACDDGLVCEGGGCVVECSCAGCEEGECDPTSGRCMHADCLGVSCDEGSHCSAGECVDDCSDAVCPGGAACRNGQCESPLDGSGATSGSGNVGTGGIVVGTGATGGSVSSGDGGSTGTASSRAVAEANSGCGCRVGARSEAGSALAALLALGLLAARRRDGAPRKH